MWDASCRIHFQSRCGSFFIHAWVTNVFTLFHDQVSTPTKIVDAGSCCWFSISEHMYPSHSVWPPHMNLMYSQTSREPSQQLTIACRISASMNNIWYYCLFSNIMEVKWHAKMTWSSISPSLLLRFTLTWHLQRMWIGSIRLILQHHIWWDMTRTRQAGTYIT